MSTRLLFVHALSPLHAGTGQSVGAVDLAIARERGTDLPFVPGSAVKGALRARSIDRALAAKTASRIKNADGEDTDRIKLDPLTRGTFGLAPNAEDPREHRGGVLFGDANLLLLPVRSVAGTFAWVTSPYLLQRFSRDLEDLGRTDLPKSVFASMEISRCFVTENTHLKVDGKVLFEDLDLVPGGHTDTAAKWANVIGEILFKGDDRWQELLSQRLCIVSNDVMSFLARHGTAVVARVALKYDTKTVDNLWHEESLPAETVLCALVEVAPPHAVEEKATAISEHLASLTDRSIQLGGKATVGRGRCRLVFGGA